MLRSIQFILAVSVAVLISVAIYSSKGLVKPTHNRSNPGVAALSQSGLYEPPDAANHDAQETVHSRNVGGGVIAAPLLEVGPLERVAAVPQPTPPLEAKSELPATPEKQFLRWRLVFNGIATSAGIVQFGETTLVLPGIDVVSADETCTASTGASWPCGMIARTAFRNYLQGRALNCHLPDRREDKAIVAECLLQGQDPAVWLVEQGWARIKPGSPFAGLAEAAKATRRGIYSLPPAGVAVKLP